MREGEQPYAFGGPGLVVGDPATDRLGVVRRSPDGRLLAIRLPAPANSPGRVVVAHRLVGNEQDWRVAHWSVIGAVPGSPAAGVYLNGSRPTRRPE